MVPVNIPNIVPLIQEGEARGHVFVTHRQQGVLTLVLDTC